LTWTLLPQGFKNSPTIFGTALASNLKAFLAGQHSCTLLQYVYDLLLAGPTQENCMEGTHFSPFCVRQDIRFPKRKLRFARILPNTLGFTCHKDSLDCPWQLPWEETCCLFHSSPHDLLTDFLGAAGFRWIWIPNYSLGKTPLWSQKVGRTGTHGMGRRARKGL
jgi:hypothetical protein